MSEYKNKRNMKIKIRNQIQELILKHMEMGFDEETAIMIVVSYLNGADEDGEWTVERVS